jgi:hypothetical protein
VAGPGGMGGLGVAAAGNLPGRWVAGPQHEPLLVRGGGTGPVQPGATGIPGLAGAPGWSSGGRVTGLGGGTGRDRASRTARAGGTSCRPGRAGGVPGQPWPWRVAGWAERPSVPAVGGGARPAGGVPGWADRVQWRAGGELGGRGTGGGGGPRGGGGPGPTGRAGPWPGPAGAPGRAWRPDGDGCGAARARRPGWPGDRAAPRAGPAARPGPRPPRRSGRRPGPRAG